tara:strand:+ start:9487 stop:9867 length:381 start_codon:yes stop_codon:yes gene_type:complete
MTTEKILWARQCDITGEGMNDGWIWGDGEFYTSTLELTLKECRKDREYILEAINNLGCDLDELDTIHNDDDLKELESALNSAKKNKDTDKDLLTIGYHVDYVYYTEWECEEDMQYEEINGTLISID